MSEKDDILTGLLERLAEELAEAYSRTPVTISSWVNVRNAYMSALSLLRLFSNEWKTDKYAGPENISLQSD